MNKKEFMNKVAKTANKVGFTLKKHSPEILIVAGIVGTVTGAVLACRATLKVNDVLSSAKKDIDNIHKCEKLEEYTQEDKTKDLITVYTRTGLKLVKLYALPVALGALSLTGVIASNNILRKRNVALAAAYIAVDRGFKEYRSRVIERYGEKTDRELRYNIKSEMFEETVIDGKGKEKIVKTKVEIANAEPENGYARVFDRSNPYYDRDEGYSLMFLKSQQAYANERLRSKGFVFLNEVYAALAIPESKAGCIVGWRYDHDGSNGDNYIDFGIEPVNRRTPEGGYEKVYMLDFNVDGDIWSDF